MKKQEISSGVWQAQAARLTAFPVPETKLSAVDWWERLLPEQPSETSTKHAKTGIYEEEGDFESGRLMLRVQRLRVDWNYSANITEAAEEIPTLGPFPDTTTNFCSLMYRWFEIAPPISRLAFGAVLIQPVEDRPKGYELITNYVKALQIDTEHSSDLLYQINRPRPSKTISDLTLNRLSKWSTLLVQGVSIHLRGGVVQPGVVADTLHAGRLELDINTSEEFSAELPKAQLADLLSEFVELGTEIASVGDIK